MDAGGTANPDSDVLVKGSGDPVYVVDALGQRRWVPDKGTFEWLGYSLANVRRLPDADLGRAPEGPHLDPHTPRLVKGSGSRVYLVTQAGRKRAIPDADTFNVLNFAWANIQRVDDGELTAMPDGPDADKLTSSSWLSVAASVAGVVFPVAAVPALLATGQTDAAVSAVKADVAAAGALATGNLGGAAAAVTGGIVHASTPPPSPPPAAPPPKPPPGASASPRRFETFGEWWRRKGWRKHA